MVEKDDGPPESVMLNAADLLDTEDRTVLLAVAAKVAAQAKELEPGFDGPYAGVVAADFLSKFFECLRDQYAEAHDITLEPMGEYSGTLQ
jgi:hypothetical protein